MNCQPIREMRAVIVAAGPSLRTLAASDLEGALVIGLSGAPVIRPDVRFDWWAIEGPVNTIDRLPPAPGQRFIAMDALLRFRALKGVSFEELRASTGFTRPYSTLTAECVLLAKHLGFEGVELFGADWREHPAPARFARESIEVRAAVASTGISLTRSGGLQETPVLAIRVRSAVVSAECVAAGVLEFRQHCQEVRTAVRRCAVRPQDVFDVEGFYYIAGDSVAPVSTFLKLRVNDGWRTLDGRPAVSIEEGIMYKIPES